MTTKFAMFCYSRRFDVRGKICGVKTKKTRNNWDILRKTRKTGTCIKKTRKSEKTRITGQPVKYLPNPMIHKGRKFAHPRVINGSFIYYVVYIELAR